MEVQSSTQQVQTFISVKDFGAKGDGVTGDAGSINAAISSAYRAGGGIVSFPTGTYVIDGTVVLRSRVQLVGSGIDATIFKAKDGLNKDVFQSLNTDQLWSGTSSGGEKYWGIAQCTIDGNRAKNTSGHAINAYARAYRIEHVKIMQAAQVGIRSRWSPSAAAWDDDPADAFMEALISNVYVGFSGEEGVWFDGPHDSRIMNLIVALNGQKGAGIYSGIYVGERSGGLQAINSHSWGDSQKYAWHVRGGYTYFIGCEADAAAKALILIEGDLVTWIGPSIGGFIFNPPSAANLNLVGFELGSDTHSIRQPYIIANLTDCPKGLVNFRNIQNAYGTVRVNGSLSPALRGPQTSGFQGAIPRQLEVSILANDVASNFAMTQSPGWIFAGSYLSAADGAASGVEFAGGNTTRVKAPSFVTLSAGGAERLVIKPGQTRFVPLNNPPTAQWQAGDVYFDSQMNKLRCFDGTVWNNLW